MAPGYYDKRGSKTRFNRADNYYSIPRTIQFWPLEIHRVLLAICSSGRQPICSAIDHVTQSDKLSWKNLTKFYSVRNEHISGRQEFLCNTNVFFFFRLQNWFQVFIYIHFFLHIRKIINDYWQHFESSNYN